MNIGKSPTKIKLPKARRGERVSDLTDGMQQQLREFEKVVRAHEFMGAAPKDAWPHIEAEYVRVKRKFIKKLWVTEGFAKDLLKLTKRGK